MNGDREDDCGQREVPLLHLRNMKVVSALGRGAKGVVFLVRTDDGQMLALKTICRALIENNNQEKITVDDDGIGGEYRRVSFEQQVLRSFRHPLLPQLRGLLSTDNVVGYAIDYCPGGDLNSLRIKQTEKIFSDDIIRFYAAELVLSLEYLHTLRVVYRDLKPENIMIQENGHLMLVDFDLSKKLSGTPRAATAESAFQSEPMKKKFHPLYRCCSSGISAEDSVHPASVASSSVSSESDSAAKSNSFVGTVEYVAPEIITGNGHDFAVDWWCLGVVLYEMLYGTTPFRGVNRKETFHKILTKSPELLGEPTALRDLIGKLLEKDTKKRISVVGIKGHDFFRLVDWNLILQMPRTPYIPVLQDSEDTNGNKVIDVEAFVHELFKIGNNNKWECNKNKHSSKETNNGVCVEGLNHPTETDNFPIF